MNKISKAIKENVLETNEITKYDSTILAYVEDYDSITNMAVLTFEDPNFKGTSKVNNVPVNIISSGLYANTIERGDNVLVSFQNNSVLMPKIVAKVDENYQLITREKSRHDKQNTYIPKILITNNYSNLDVDTNNINISSPYDDWFTTINQDINDKYKDKNPIDDLNKSIANIPYYDCGEVGLTHPSTRSSIHFKNDGSINVSVEDDIGIVIDKNTKTININANGYNINSKNIDIKCDSLTINGKEVIL